MRPVDPKNIRTVREALTLVGIHEDRMPGIVTNGFAPELRAGVTAEDVARSLARLVEVPEAGPRCGVNEQGRFHTYAGGGVVLYQWCRVSGSSAGVPYHLASSIALVIAPDSGVGQHLALVTLG